MTLFFKNFALLRAFFAIILSTSLVGCAAPMIYALAMAPSAYVAYQGFVPEGTEIVRKNPDGGVIDQVAMKKIETIVTNNPEAREHLLQAGFTRVIVTKHNVDDAQAAARVAKANGVDAYMWINTDSPALARNNLKTSVIFGRANVRIYYKGEEVYHQVATLQQKSTVGNSITPPTEEEVTTTLANVIIDDMKQGMGAVTGTTDDVALGKY